MANDSSIAHLIVKQLRQDLTGKEGDVLEDWLNDAPANRDFLEGIRQENELLAGLKVLEEMDREAIRQKIEYFRQLEKPSRRPKTIRRVMYGALAAAVVAAICWGVYTLTAKSGKNTEVAYSTVTVPHGKRQQVFLPDGTQVTLNTGSKLKYPAAFDQGERVVELQGEGFFVVKKDVEHPFIVKSERQQVLVMGTSFSVRDYPDETLQRTILETGKIEVQSRKGRVVLQPGQEAQVDSSDDAIRVSSNADAKNLYPWKDGYFNFDNIDIRAAVWQLAQWYNKKVSFSADVKKGTLGSGNIQQDLPLDKLLKDLELPDLHFKLSHDTIFVTR